MSFRRALLTVLGAIGTSVASHTCRARDGRRPRFIMVAVFGGFVFKHGLIIKSIGFALAFGVLAVAFVAP
ncbi:hypothetical protein [Streptomyces sp. NPDC046862]|uniref:hypothetical protein n=1 Tax=Streptomyces sp. NPDC046862 TaxID=3154603 RepID=UPI003452835A